MLYSERLARPYADICWVNEVDSVFRLIAKCDFSFQHIGLDRSHYIKDIARA